jgi:hypothetical protein
MRRVVSAIVLACVWSQIASAQVFAGDSLRLRKSREAAWNHGRLLIQDGSTFTLRSGVDTLRLGITDLQRVDRWKRNSPGLILITASVGALAAGLGYNASTPEEERLPGAYWKWWLGGAAGGAVIGLVAYNAWPGQWRIIIDR